MIADPAEVQTQGSNRSAASRKILLLLILFAIVCTLYKPAMRAHLPGLDESFYLYRGALYIERGQMHPLADNPGPTLVNGGIYALHHPDRLQLENVSTVRRWLTLGLIFFGTFYAGISCGIAYRFAAAAAVLAAASPSMRFIVNNSSDALYAIFLLFVFGWTVREIKNLLKHTPRSIAWYLVLGLLLCSLAMSRNDGLIVGMVVLLLLGWLFRKNSIPLPIISTRLVSGGAGFLIPLGLWWLFAGLQTGDWSTHIPERSYVAFSQGQNILFAGRFSDSLDVPTAAAKFGTAEQNHNSILRAIVRHPGAFSERLRRLPSNILESAIAAFGGKFEFLITTCFLLVGIVLLFRTQNSLLALLGGACLLPLLVYPMTFFRPGYLAMNFPVLCVLSICGIAGAAAKRQSPIYLRTTVALLAGVILLNCIQVWRGEHQLSTALANNDVAQRRWVVEMQQAIPKNTAVLAADPSLLWYAHLEQHDDPDFLLSPMSPTKLSLYMHSNQLNYILIDQYTRQIYPGFTKTIETSDLQLVLRDSVYGAAVYRTRL